MGKQPIFDWENYLYERPSTLMMPDQLLRRQGFARLIGHKKAKSSPPEALSQYLVAIPPRSGGL
jgi:hypothetical protein